jgi:sec-independent protein translocase protein TatA
MRAFEPWHLIVLLAVGAVLFGSRRLPDAARGLGRALRIFKAEVRELREEDRRPDARSSPGAASSSPDPEPLEGRIVKGDGPGRASSEQRRDG